MTIESKRTERFLPVVPSDVLPKHELQREPAELQQQYATAS